MPLCQVDIALVASIERGGKQTLTFGEILHFSHLPSVSIFITTASILL